MTASPRPVDRPVDRPVACTGVKPTGEPHLGNYVGAIRPAIRLTDTYDAYYFIADYHALTTVRDRELMRRYTRSVAATWLACGLDPTRTVFYKQSDVPETFELMWVLASVTPKGMMNRAHAYKAMLDRNREAGEEPDAGVEMGLYNYPILMAADILITGADVVPVGLDQLQHIEYARDLAERYNAWVGEDYALPVPSALAVAAESSVPGTDGRKMSKSYGNTLQLFDDPARTAKLVRGITTDSSAVADPKDPDTAVVQLYDRFATPEMSADLHARLRAGGIGWGDVKKELAAVLEETLGPLRERYEGYLAEPDVLDDILRDGAARARTRAVAILDRVRAGVGTGTGTGTGT